jgi:hypothetical protein
MPEGFSAWLPIAQSCSLFRSPSLSLGPTVWIAPCFSLSRRGSGSRLSGVPGQFDGFAWPAHGCVRASLDVSVRTPIPAIGSNKCISDKGLAGEQSDTLCLLRHNDRKSRHRRIKKQRRYVRLAATSQFLTTVPVRDLIRTHRTSGVEARLASSPEPPSGGE